MNKQEKIIAFLLGLTLVGWLWYSFSEQKKAMEAAQAAAVEQAAAQTNQTAAVAQPGVKTDDGGTAVPPAAAESNRVQSAAAPEAKPFVPSTPEKIVVLENDQIAVSLSSHGAVVKRATLKEYAAKPGAVSEQNPAVVLDFSVSPALAVDGVPALPSNADFTVAESGGDFVLFKSVAVTGGKPVLSRRITLKSDYQLAVEDEWAEGGGDAPGGAHLSLGGMSLGSSKNDILSIDSWIVSDAKGKSRVEHHGETDPLKSYLAGSSGGCSSAPNAAGMPVRSVVDVSGARSWVAVKNRFFVTALVGLSANDGFRAAAERDPEAQNYLLKSVSAEVAFSRLPAKASYVLFVGPKKQSLLWSLGMKDVMEFGMWRWICYPMVWVLNLFNSWIPNYGVAIILLTFLVRLIFWPLTHKSTISMRRMSEIQPKIKEIQAKYKDNPQRLQQEMFACYRENKVNPMASCLPMLIQIPVFIALFTVLRSAVELRYAPFLWIADLSEPEALGADSWFPFFGGLNILPVLMAATMALQSALTPSTGDKNQQRMMMVMMPAMMLFMFYSFPSALSLYWTLSQVISIVQMWWIRKKYTPAPAKSGAIDPDAVEMPVTRQMRRHQR
jgi:YidC/Oxa1 family membrane protein insertase